MDWTLADGIELVKVLQPMTREFGYHLTLGGSVLNTGLSKKDLDLFFLPLDSRAENPPTNPLGLLAKLQKMWGPGKPISSSGERDLQPTVTFNMDGPILAQPRYEVFEDANGQRRMRQLDAPGGQWLGAGNAGPRVGVVNEDLEQVINVAAPPPTPRYCQARRCLAAAMPGQHYCERHAQEARGVRFDGAPTTSSTPTLLDGIYKLKYKFVRGKNDRIDVFILGA